jgi:hypothetical protein
MATVRSEANATCDSGANVPCTAQFQRRDDLVTYRVTVRGWREKDKASAAGS